jgi:glycosyltransferase involved in cell wall biosynthesis
VKISICMPLRNRRDLLRWGLASLCWWQDADPDLFEIVIADDGSTDDPEPIIAEFREAADIKWVWCGQKSDPERHNNGGPARNAAMRHATGDVIVQTEPEIVHLGDSIQAALSLHRERDDLVGLCGEWWRVPADAETLRTQGAALAQADVRSRDSFIDSMGPVWKGLKRRGIGRHNPPQVFLSVHRRWIIDELNGYDERFWHYGGEDQDLIARLRACRLEVVEQPDVRCAHLGHTKLGVLDQEQWQRQRAMISGRPVKRNEGTWLGETCTSTL